MGKLKKSNLLKKIRRYKVKENKQDFIKKHPKKVVNVTFEDDEVIYYTNEYSESGKDLYKVILKKIKLNLINIISVAIVILIFATSNLYIRQITFKNENTFDYEIYKFTEAQLKKFGNIYLIKTSVNEISNSLRENYPNFQYIGAQRTGSTIVIEIVKIKYDTIDYEKHSYGNLIASSDGVVMEISCLNGVRIVNLNQTVKKGDLLISGNINHFIDPLNNSKTVVAQGKVFAYTINYESYRVDKQSQETTFSSNISQQIQVELFKKPLFKQKSPYQDYYLKYDQIFSLSNFFKVYKLSFYEIVTYEQSKNKEEAYEFILSKIKTTFINKKTSDKEKIIYIKLMNYEEFSDYFLFKFLIKRYENIGKMVIIR